MASPLRGRTRSGLPTRIDNDTIGDLLFAVTALGDEHGIDPEQALRDAVRRFAAAVRATEAAARRAQLGRGEA